MFLIHGAHYWDRKRKMQLKMSQAIFSNLTRRALLTIHSDKEMLVRTRKAQSKHL
jgi:hypothetical protein